jgi:hypothetical protein
MSSKEVKIEDYWAETKAAQTTTAEMTMMVRMMGCLMAEMKVAQTTMAEMKAASLAEEMADVMVRMMDCLLAASLAEKKAVSLA